MISWFIGYKRRLARLTAVVFTGFLLVHFTLTLVYTLPDVYPLFVLKGTANVYMRPLFHQGWELFAPNVPQQQFALEYRFADGSEWSEWQSAEEATGALDHPRTPYVAQKLQIMLARDLSRNLTYDEQGREDYSLVVNDVHYYRVLYFTVQQHYWKYGAKPQRIQLRMHVQHTPAPDYSQLQSPPEDRTFTFPAEDLPDL